MRNFLAISAIAIVTLLIYFLSVSVNVAPIYADPKGDSRMIKNAIATQTQQRQQQANRFGGGNLCLLAHGNEAARAQNNFQVNEHESGFIRSQSRTFGFIDVDLNDLITLEEFLAHASESVDERFAAIDTDSDGSISPSEFMNIGSHPETEPGINANVLNECVNDCMGPGANYLQDRQAKFEEIDTNDDGVIDLEEFTVHREQVLIARFTLIDEDGDSIVSRLELCQAFEMLRTRRYISQDCVEEQLDMNELVDG